MTLPSTASRITHLANGTATQFSFNFKIFEKAHLQVIVTSPTGSETIIATNAFNVNAGGLNNDNGGIITYPISGAPLATGNKITIQSNVPYDQIIALTNETTVKPEAIELGLDRIVMQIKQLQDKTERTVQTSVASSGSAIRLPNGVADKVLGWDSNLTLVNVDKGEGGGVGLPITINDVTGLQTSLDNKINRTGTANRLLGYNAGGAVQSIQVGTGLSLVSGVLSATSGGGVTLPINISDVTNLQTELNSKALGTHNHPQSSITNLVADLAARPLTAALGALAFLGVVATANISNAAVTHVKMQTSTPNSLLGYNASGNPSTVTIGAGLTLSGGVLAATGGGGGATSLDGLSDVSISTPAARQTLRHDGTDFKNARLQFADLNEVTLTAISGGNAQRFIMNGADRIQIEQTVSQVSHFATLSLIRNNQTTGGTGTGNGIYVDLTAGVNVGSNQWGITSVLKNYAPLGAGGGNGGENCAGYFQALHYNAGSSWGVAFEAQDLPDGSGNRGGILWGTENLLVTKRTNLRANLCVEVLLNRNFGDGDAGRIYAYSLADAAATQSPQNTAQYGYLVGDKDNRIAFFGGSRPTVNNGFAVYADGITGFQDEGSKQVGLNLGGSYSTAAILIPSNSRIGMNGTNAVGIGFNSGAGAIEVNTNFNVGGALSVSSNINSNGSISSSGSINTSGIRLNSDGLIELLSTARYSNGGYGALWFNGQAWSGRFIQLSIPGRGTDAYIPIMVSNTGNGA